MTEILFVLRFITELIQNQRFRKKKKSIQKFQIPIQKNSGKTSSIPKPGDSEQTKQIFRHKKRRTAVRLIGKPLPL